MKIKTEITEIECSAEELRQSTSLSDGLYNAMRRVFNGPVSHTESKEESEEEE